MQTLQDLTPVLTAQAKPYLMQKYPITSIGVFGSYARGEADPASDLDILLDYAPDTGRKFSLFDLVHIQDYLKDLTGIPVDISLKSSLKSYIAPRILKETIYL